MTEQATPSRNTSGVSPLGRAVLVRYYQPERKGSTIFIPDNVRKGEVLVEQRAEVLEIGPNAWPGEPARAEVGDRILIAAFSGYSLKGPADGQMYRIINDQDIFARITAEEQDNG